MRSKDIISEKPGTIQQQTINKGPDKGNYKYNPNTGKYDNTGTGQSLDTNSPAYDKLKNADDKAKRKQDNKAAVSKRVDPRDDRSKYNQQGDPENNKRVDQQIAQNFGDTDSVASGGKNTRVQQYKIDKAAKARDAKSKVGGDVSDFAKQRIKVGDIQTDDNGLFYQYTENGWIEVTGISANAKTGKNTGTPKIAPGSRPLPQGDALAKQLTSKAQGKDQTGFIDQMKKKAGDVVNKAIGGPLASKTANDPDATTGQKLGAKFGAGIGRAMSHAFKKGDPAGAKKAVVPIAANDLKAFQSMILKPDVQPEQKLQMAQDMVSKLVKMHGNNTDVENYLNTVGPILKQSGLNKTNPAEYKALVTQARSLRAEAYQYMNKVLEAVGLTWEDLGYKVIISESITDSVILIPIQDIQLSNIKKLAGL